MHILLVTPPHLAPTYDRQPLRYPPIGVASLAAVAKCLSLNNTPVTVEVIDLALEGWTNRVPFGSGHDRIGLARADFIDRLKTLQRPDVIGLSWLFSQQTPVAGETLADLRQVFAGTPILVGGSHPSVAWQTTLQNFSAVDFVIVGEGEETFTECLKKFAAKESPLGLPGIAGRDATGQPVFGGLRPPLDFSALPMPDYEAIQLKRYFEILPQNDGMCRQFPYLLVYTSRGCPNDCVFCSVKALWGSRYRARTPDQAMEELTLLATRYGVKEAQFGDDNLTLQRDRARSLFKKMAEKKLGLSWRTPNGIFMATLDEEMAILMKESGCYRISLGLETGNQPFLDQVIGKRQDLGKTAAIVQIFRRQGIGVDAMFILGLPGETLCSALRTILFAARIDADTAGFFLPQPYPGTRLAVLCEQEGYGQVPDPTTLRTDQAHLETPWLSGGELELLGNLSQSAFRFLRALLHRRRFIESCRTVSAFRGFLRDGLRMCYFGLRIFRRTLKRRKTHPTPPPLPYDLKKRIF